MFGLRVPKTVDEAYEIDDENGNTLWQDAIAKEMNAIRSKGSFKTWTRMTPEDLRANPQALPGCQEIGCHLMFAIKMDGKFARKARFVLVMEMKLQLPLCKPIPVLFLVNLYELLF